MRFRQIRAIYTKEMRDILRDRRTLFVMIILPILLYPLLMIGVLQLSVLQAKKLRKEPAKVVLVGARGPVDIYRTLDSSQTIELTSVLNWQQALSDGELHAAVEIPPGFADSIEAKQATFLTIHYNAAKERSQEAKTKIEYALEHYQESIVTKRFEALAVDTSLLHPFATRLENVATSEEMSGFFLGKFLGYLLIIMAMLGAFYPAIDLTAGEKERGTMETLLVSPARRGEIVYGKFFAILSVSIVTTLLNLGSMGVTFSWGMQQIAPQMGSESLGFGITAAALASIALILLPMAVFFSAICMAVATPARSYKEGQNLLTPLYMVVILPAIVSVLPGVEISPTLAVIPIVNVSLLTKEFLVGHYPLVEIALTFLSSCLIAVMALSWAVSQFRSETVLFRHAEDIRWSPFRRPIVPRTFPSSAGALFLYFVVLILVFFVGGKWQSASLLPGLFKTEVLLILLPPIIVLVWGRYDIRRALGLVKPAPMVWIPTIIFMVGGWLLAVEIAALQNLVFPYPEEFQSFFEGLFKQLNSLPLLQAIAVIAFLPAICEELLCRGFLLRAWLPRLGKTRAIIAVAVVFGVLHLDPYRLLTTAFLGFLLTVLAVETGSIFPAMLGHALINGSTFFILRQEDVLGGSAGLSLEEELLPWYLVVGAMLLFALGWWWLKKVTGADKQIAEPD